MSDLAAQFGNIDIYLFDQLLRGRLRPPMRVLDAGCGSGRNLIYLLDAGFEVFATDREEEAIRAVRTMVATRAPRLPERNFRVEPVEAMTFGAGTMDAVLSSAVLHFARDDGQFEAMVDGMWTVLAPGGLLFCRLASSMGMEHRVQPVGDGRFRLPDGSERYLVDEARLVATTRRLGGALLDPLKTTIVQDQRCMTTWVVRKSR